MRWPVVLLVLVLAAACGGESQGQRHADPRSIELGWHETDGPFEVDVDRLVIRRNGWSAVLSFTNGTRAFLAIDRPHYPDDTNIGLVLLRTDDAGEVDRLTPRGSTPPVERALRFDPPLLRLVPPGGTWRGTISGDRRLPHGRFVRISLGRFVASSETQLGTHFHYITVHAALL